MGSNPSRSTQTEYTRNQSDRAHNHSNQPSRSVHPLSSTQRKRPLREEPDWSESAQRKRAAHDHFEWPLPPDEVHAPFQLIDNSGSERYSLTPLSPRGSTPSTPKPRAKAIELHNERDTSNEDWRKQIDSQNVDSAHVQSQLSARFHACFNLSASDNIDLVMNGLKKTYQDLDERLKRRLTKISGEAEQKIILIVDETKEDQRHLLAYDKQRQLRQDELYQEWLQKYIVELNTWRSRELAKLQRELLKYQQQIVNISKRKIDRINDEANHWKTLILDQEKNIAAKRTSQLTDQMYDMTREDAHFLGSESKTELNLKIQANVGKIAPGQSCTNGKDN